MFPSSWVTLAYYRNVFQCFSVMQVSLNLCFVSDNSQWSSWTCDHFKSKQTVRYFITEFRMAILGSREHLCVHPEVSRSKNKNDGCRELLDTKTVSNSIIHHVVLWLTPQHDYDVVDILKLYSLNMTVIVLKVIQISFCFYYYLIW